MRSFGAQRVAATFGLRIRYSTASRRQAQCRSFSIFRFAFLARKSFLTEAPPLVRLTGPFIVALSLAGGMGSALRILN